RRLMAEQRDRAKADSRAKKVGLADLSAYRAVAEVAGRTEFRGYTETETEATVRGVVRDGAVVPSAAVGDVVEVVLDRTAFYAEGGGQLGDQGEIRLANGGLLRVDDVQSPLEGLVVHRARVLDGEVTTGLTALGVVDVLRRGAISRAHTATHMVHKAMREMLGDTATQAGSENAPGRFRFDFPNPGAVPAGVLVDVEQKVNEVLVTDLAVTADLMSLADARAAGAMALFGEKYGDVVRVVSVGEWTRELCGGTHAHRTGQLGVVKLLGEASIGAGVRRIEALVGLDAYRFLAREHTLVHLLTEQLKARPEELPDRVAALVERLRVADKELERYRREQLAGQLAGVAGDGEPAGPVRLWAFRAPDGLDGGSLRDVALQTRGRAGTDPAAVVALSAAGPKVAVVAAVNEAAQAAGVTARGLLAVALPHVGGRGGGKDDVAQGGGDDASGIESALAAVAADLRGR
ncbi:MAG: alanine--tRNA ligase-related protein, partial [Actinomycetota bacterium]|nr:alanine--tRNA ligase-related protein [Actinomycetota bacterium]